MNPSTNGEADQAVIDRLQEKLDRMDEKLESERTSRANAETKLDDLKKALRNEYDVDPNDVAEGVAPEGKVKKVNSQPVNPTRIEWEPMPKAALPDPVSEYATAIRAADDLDETLFAAPALSVLGAAIGNTVHFELRPGWTEIPTVWMCPLLPSGEGKSHALQKALAPAQAKDSDAHDQYTERLREWEQTPEDARGQKPERRHYTVNDITAETAGLRHGENPRGLLLYRDELAGFIGGMDQYKQGDSDLQTWIEMYDGNAVKIDRKSSDPSTLYIPSPAVCITGTMQPEVMREKMQPAHFQAGFAQRLWMVQPPTYSQEWSSAGIDPSVRRRYHCLVENLYRLPYDAENSPKIITMDGSAEEVWKDYYNRCAKIKDQLVSNPLRSMVAKSEALAARLALIIQIARSVGTGKQSSPMGALDGVKIDMESMQRAVVLSEWFQREAARVYQMYGFDERGVSRDTSNARKLPEPFGWQDVAELWDVSKQGAYNVIDRLTNQGLAEKTGHGEYTSHAGDGPEGDFGVWGG